MQNERKRILDMLENGVINAEEALLLLENLGKNQQLNQNETTSSIPDTQPVKVSLEKTEQSRQQEQTQSQHTQNNAGEKKSADDFFEDIKRDFNHFGDRFMQFVQTAIEKVKAFDFDHPIDTVEFHHTFTKENIVFDEIVVDLTNGKLEIFPTTEQSIRAECHVKSYFSQSEETSKQEFLDKFIFVVDDNKLRILSDSKKTQVNISLYVPEKQYAALSSNLFNGAFKLHDMQFEKVKVKTANGKIDVRNLQFVKANFETANGAIQLQDIKGNELEAETLNGRVYIDGEVKEIEAQSVNGHVVVTTKDKEARKIEARTMAGVVELYIPSNLSLQGEISSNFGKMDLQLPDITRVNESDQFLQKSIRFSKEVPTAETSPLQLIGEAKTGSILVRYHS